METTGEANREGATQINQWSEFVDDLWDTHLPHLMEETYGDGGFVYDPKTGHYGFEEWSEYESEDEFLKDDGEELSDVRQSTGEEEPESEYAFLADDEEEAVGQQATVAHSYDLGQSTDEESESEDEYEVSELPGRDHKCKIFCLSTY